MGTFHVGRVYDAVNVDGATRVLVDRLWPRGISKDGAPFELWEKDVAPSTELRKWYDHVPERFEEFSLRYRTELFDEAGSAALARLRDVAQRGEVVLLTATKDVPHSGATVLLNFLTNG